MYVSFLFFIFGHRHGFGDSARPLQESAQLIEEVVLQQMTSLVSGLHVEHEPRTWPEWRVCRV